MQQKWMPPVTSKFPMPSAPQNRQPPVPIIGQPSTGNPQRLTSVNFGEHRLAMARRKS